MAGTYVNAYKLFRKCTITIIRKFANSQICKFALCEEFQLCGVLKSFGNTGLQYTDPIHTKIKHYTFSVIIILKKSNLKKELVAKLLEPGRQF